MNKDSGEKYKELNHLRYPLPVYRTDVLTSLGDQLAQEGIRAQVLLVRLFSEIWGKLRSRVYLHPKEFLSPPTEII